MSVAPNSKALAELLRRKFSSKAIRLAYEAGFCGFYIVRELIEEGIDAIVINPADIPTSDKDSRYKTDERDSLKIAMALKANMLEPIYVPDLEDEQNQSLFRRRMDLVKKQTRIKNQIKSLLKKYGIRPQEEKKEMKQWTKAYIKWLEEVAKSHCLLRDPIGSMLRELSFYTEEKGKVELCLKELSQIDKYKKNHDILVNTPGIGMIVAMAIILELIDMGRFKRFPNLASYIGLIPTEHSSGDKQRFGRMTRRSKTILKTLLIEAAWILISKDEAFKEYYKSLLTRMKPQEAIIRCAKKLLRRIYHILSNGEEYQINLAA
jgi:transposase